VIRTVHLRDLGGWVSSIPKERHAAAVKAVRLTARSIARPIINEEINATRPHAPVDRRDYMRSWTALAIENGIRIFSSSPYASVIDGGRRPGSNSSIQALIGWVHRHGLADRSETKAISWNRNRKLSFTDSLAAQKLSTKKIVVMSVANQEKSIAFAIAAAIKKRGLPAKHVFERASKRIVVELREAARAAIAGAQDKAGA
jgi:hypothetical protein